MSFYNTGNPVPSDDPRDLDDNAKHLDESVNSTSDTWTDRNGVSRSTLKKIEADANSLRADLSATHGADLVVTTRPDSTAATVEDTISEMIYPTAKRDKGNAAGMFLLATAVRKNAAGTWILISDSAHVPVGNDSVEINAGDSLRIFHTAGMGEKTGAMAVTPDETLAKHDVTPGASVGSDSSVIYMYAPSKVILSIDASGVATLARTGAFSASRYNTTIQIAVPNAQLTLTHPGRQLDAEGVKITPYSPGSADYVDITVNAPGGVSFRPRKNVPVLISRTGGAWVVDTGGDTLGGFPHGISASTQAGNVIRVVTTRDRRSIYGVSVVPMSTISGTYAHATLLATADNRTIDVVFRDVAGAVMAPANGMQFVLTINGLYWPYGSYAIDSGRGVIAPAADMLVADIGEFGNVWVTGAHLSVP